LAVDGQTEIIRITGVDLSAVTGISVSLALTILSEIGTDMSCWPSVKHFTSWLGLAPHNDISGGKVLRSRIAAVIIRATSFSAVFKSYMGVFRRAVILVP
jgi:transposase